MMGEELRTWRTARAVSQDELARWLAVPVVTIRRWEHREQPIRHGEILRLALAELARIRRWRPQ